MTTIRVTGMTCPACERRVVRALSALPGVTSVSASAARGRAVLNGARPSPEALRDALGTAGYSLGAPPWVSRDRRTWAVTGLLAVVVTALGVAASRAGLEVPAPSSQPQGSSAGVVLALLVGLAAGVSTCMALVGGLVLSISASGGGEARRLRPHLVFALGRIAGFAVGGALLGTLGSAARIPGSAVASLTLVAAAVMALLGIRLTGVSPRLAGWALTLPRRWNERFGLRHDRGLVAAGAATFLLPCGFTQAMQLYAISLGDPVGSTAVMVAFALGTAPGLLGLGALGGLSAGRRGSEVPLRAVGVLVLAFAVVSGAGGLRALGVPLAPGRDGGQLTGAAVSPNVTLDGGVQVVTMKQDGDGYSPAHTTVWAGVPIRWTIDVTATLSCSAFLRMPSKGIKADFTRPGPHVVDIPSLDPGTTTFSCVMGMYNGSFRAIPRPSAG